MEKAIYYFINSIYEFIKVLINSLEKLIPFLEKHLIESDLYYELDLLLETLKKFRR